jgi:hypothetical protein
VFIRVDLWLGFCKIFAEKQGKWYSVNRNYLEVRSKLGGTLAAIGGLTSVADAGAL